MFLRNKVSKHIMVLCIPSTSKPPVIFKFIHGYQIKAYNICCSVTQSCLTLCDPINCSRLPHPSPSPKVCSESCPSSRWCHPTISSSVAPFSSCPQSFPASESFLMGQLFSSGGQSIGALDYMYGMYI